MFLVRLFLSRFPLSRSAAPNQIFPIKASVGQVHAAVAQAHQDVLVKVVIRNLVNLLDVKLQETREKEEKTAADAVITSDKLEVPETPDCILFGR
jgi:hypothetical protein